MRSKKEKNEQMNFTTPRRFLRGWFTNSNVAVKSAETTIWEAKKMTMCVLAEIYIYKLWFSEGFRAAILRSGSIGSIQ